MKYELKDRLDAMLRRHWELIKALLAKDPEKELRKAERRSSELWKGIKPSDPE